LVSDGIKFIARLTKACHLDYELSQDADHDWGTSEPVRMTNT
jgi:hypothetical protein